jgi:uncharacterized protein (TIGR02246 family)
MTRPPVPPFDEESAHQKVKAAEDGWNSRDPEKVAQAYTEDSEWRNRDEFFKGREEIAPFHKQLFEKWLKGTRLVGRVEDVRFLSPDVALMHAVGGTVLRGNSEPSPERDSIQTLVAVRQEGGAWRLAAFQNTRLHPMDSSVGPFLVWTLSDQLWKVYRQISQRIRPRRQGG